MHRGYCLLINKGTHVSFHISHFTTGFGCEHPGTISPEQRQEYSVSAVPPPPSMFLPPHVPVSCLFTHPSLLSLLSLMVILPFPFHNANSKLAAASGRNGPTGCYQPDPTNHFP